MRRKKRTLTIKTPPMIPSEWDGEEKELWQFPIQSQIFYLLARIEELEKRLAAPLKPKKCPVCKGKFTTHDERQLYCSGACKQKAYRRREKV